MVLRLPAGHPHRPRQPYRAGLGHRGRRHERDAGADLPDTGPPPPPELLADKGFAGAAFTAAQAVRGTAVLVPPSKNQRAAMPTILQKIMAKWRNRVETTLAEITDHMELARHGAHTFWACSPAPRRPSPPTPCCGST